MLEIPRNIYDDDEVMSACRLLEMKSNCFICYVFDKPVVVRMDVSLHDLHLCVYHANSLDIIIQHKAAAQQGTPTLIVIGLLNQASCPERKFDFKFE